MIKSKLKNEKRGKTAVRTISLLLGSFFPVRRIVADVKVQMCYNRCFSFTIDGFCEIQQDSIYMC